MGLRRTAGKLRWLLRHFAFGPVRDSLDSLQAAAGEEYDYGRAAS